MTLNQWIKVNDFISGPVRVHVVKHALDKLQERSGDLILFAKQVFESNIHIDGFRGFFRAPRPLQMHHADYAFQKNGAVCDVIVGLWAVSKDPIFQSFEENLRKSKLYIPDSWTPKEGLKGFFEPGSNRDLSGLTKELSEGKDTLERGLFLLSEFWFSGGVVGQQEKVADEIYQEEDLSMDEKFLTMSIPGLKAELHKVQSEVYRLQEAVDVTLDNLKNSLKDQYTALFEEVFLKLSDQKEDWIYAILHEVDFFELLSRRLLDEVMERSDMPWYGQKDEIFPIEAIPEGYELAEKLLADIEEYDKKRKEVIQVFRKKQTELADLIKAISVWERQEERKDHSYWVDDENISEMSIKGVQTSVDRLGKSIEDVAIALKTYRSRAVRNVLSRVEEISELSTNPGVVVIDCLALPEITEAYLSKLVDPDLIKLTNAVEDVHTEMLSNARSDAAVTAANLLIEDDWDAAVYLDLVTGLTNEKRSGELLILQLAASKLRYLNEAAFDYNARIVDVLFAGLDYFAGVQSSPFGFVASLLPAFLNGWRPAEPEKLAEVCILTTIANCQSDCQLPSGFFWTIAESWPLPEEMPTWGSVWTGLLHDNPKIIYTDEGERKAKEALDRAKRSLDLAFNMDGGHYTRLSSLSSNRHRMLIVNHFMDDFEVAKRTLLDYIEKLSASNPNRLTSKVEALKNYLTNLESEDFSEDELERKYNASVYEENINDQKPFHKRVAIQNIHNCAEELLNFGKSLLNYWRLVESRKEGIKFQDLFDELNTLDIKSVLLTGITEQSIKVCDVDDLPKWEESTSDANTKDGVLRKLIKERAYAMRMPYLIAFLVNNEFSWKKIYENILRDIANPMTPEDAAEYLVQQEAMIQASLLEEFVKKESHSLLVKKQNLSQIRELQRELQTLDISSKFMTPEFNNEIKRDIELGRWGRLRRTLEASVELLRSQHEEKENQLNQEISDLREAINNLDKQLFTQRDDILQEAFYLVIQALGQAKIELVSVDIRLIPIVKDYLKLIEYRLERHSWPINEVREITEDFLQRLSLRDPEEGEKLSIEELSQALAEGHYEELGLSRSQFEGSRVQTRLEILDYWIRLKNENGIFDGEYSTKVPDLVRTLHRFFAQMIQMKRVPGKDGRLLKNEKPLVYEYWQLMYPKTVELNSYCILMTLPGGSISGPDIRKLNEFLVSKDFESAFFVFVFAPGCPQNLTKKIFGSKGGDRLIVIDDSLMNKLVMAEAQGKNPVDVIRPLMMQSMQDSATVFIFNQATNEYTGIFVGREKLIRELASGSENYAVYGGRRIGKSSLLNAVKSQIESNNRARVIYRSLEGETDFNNLHISGMFAKDIGIFEDMSESGDFKDALSKYLVEHPEESLVIMIDEIDRYIDENNERHLMIEALRACSDQFGSRLRIVVSGFMELYKCLKGQGPYSANSDPWSRMFQDMSPLGNLEVHEAESIVKEGFVSILGWKFENRTIPQMIVERTGGHPAFVQRFCAKLLDYVRTCGRHLIKASDVDAVYEDNNPNNSFMAYVLATLQANLDLKARFLLLWMAQNSSDASGFTLSEIKDLATVVPVPIPDEELDQMLETMTVTSVVEKRSANVFDFTVKDYPNILAQLSSGDVLNELERQIKEESKPQEANA